MIEISEDMRRQFTKYRMIARIIKKDAPMVFNDIANEYERILGKRHADNGLRAIINNMIDLGMIKKVKVNIPSGSNRPYSVGFIRLVDIPDKTGQRVTAVKKQ